MKKYVIFRKIITYPKSSEPFNERFRKIIQNIKTDLNEEEDNISKNTLDNLIKSKTCSMPLTENNSVKKVIKKKKTKKIGAKKRKKTKKISSVKRKASRKSSTGKASNKKRKKSKKRTVKKKSAKKRKKPRKKSTKKRKKRIMNGGRRLTNYSGGLRKTSKIKKRLSKRKTQKNKFR